jgi:hypothetical protein
MKTGIIKIMIFSLQPTNAKKLTKNLCSSSSIIQSVEENPSLFIFNTVSNNAVITLWTKCISLHIKNDITKNNYKASVAGESKKN